jgi:hypothetical protein
MEGKTMSIRLITIPIDQNIHIDQLRDLDPVTIDMWGEVEMEVQPNRHHMTVDLESFQDRIVDYVEKNHPLDEERIVEGWEVPSYNLIKELNTNGIGGDKRCTYVMNVDMDGYVESVVIMTERNCPYVLDWVLELVT